LHYFNKLIANKVSSRQFMCSVLDTSEIELTSNLPHIYERTSSF